MLLEPPIFIVAAPRAGSSVVLEALARAPEVAHSGRRLENEPENALRIPRLAAEYPAACFIYVYRDPRHNIASMIEAQTSAGRSRVDNAVAQWERVNRQILEDLASLSADTWTATTYEALCKNPVSELARLARFAGITLDDSMALLVRPADASKWRTHDLDIMPRLASLADTNRRAKLVCATAIETPIAAPRSNAAAVASHLKAGLA